MRQDQDPHKEEKGMGQPGKVQATARSWEQRWIQRLIPPPSTELKEALGVLG